MITSPLLGQTELPVTAYDFATRKFIGTYANSRKAANSLFIRTYSSVFTYANSKRPNRRGVKSYKGQVYHFELAKPE